MNAKIRDAELLKIPYMLVLGRREVEERTVSVRSRHKPTQDSMSLDAFMEKVVAESVSRT